MNFQILDSIGIARELNVAKAFKENQIQFYETRIKKVKQSKAEAISTAETIGQLEAELKDLEATIEFYEQQAPGLLEDYFGEFVEKQKGGKHQTS